MASTATIQFNSLNQKLSNVLFDGKPVKAVESSDKKQLTTITLHAPVRPAVQDAGRCRRRTAQHDVPGDRRAPHGPVLDEPAFRAVFKLTVTTRACWAMYLNRPQVAQG